MRKGRQWARCDQKCPKNEEGKPSVKPLSRRFPRRSAPRFEPIVKALGPARAALAKEADVVAVRPGYDYADPASPVPAVVVAVRPGAGPVGKAGLAKQLGVPVAVTDASVDEQIAAIQRDEEPSRSDRRGRADFTARNASGRRGRAGIRPPKTRANLRAARSA